MKYAVIKTGGKQYRVSEGDIIEVDKLDVKENSVVFDNVLLLVSDENVQIGKPLVQNAKVKAKLLEQKRGAKIRVAKFKSKVRYRRASGFRAELSKIQIEKIDSLEKAKPAKAKKVSKKR
ncbi:MAG: 50S ribosomal protein L21 [Patescibacteria group bacterium]|nr:50S ribosomal protein L21 [Patescibacteria group bacterium]